MKIRHGDHNHDVYLMDDGTMDTVIEVDEVEVRYSEARRHRDGSVVTAWLREAAIEACDDDMLTEETN